MSKENKDEYFNLGTLVYYFDVKQDENAIDYKYMQSGIRIENQLGIEQLNRIIQTLSKGRYEFKIVLNTDNSTKVETIDSEFEQVENEDFNIKKL